MFTPDLGGRVAGDAAVEEGGVALGEGDTQSLKEVFDDFGLFLAGLPGLNHITR